MIYKAAKLVINSKNYNYESLESDLSLFLMMTKITQEQYVELIGLMDAQQTT
ncbi:hypothetical protein QH639_20265 [Lysinibacillus sp. 1 U-2021]|uniref:hypothetical protein n=1 Tax=Lysinibacillus sp. 1 U-2021 TaxID=3039426 RepID=UPI00248095AA|nr:hypothetical protein [Lysinibacillus sp. 1 U-2021]WGT38133.1 hypothetical protein QH639_20265 [Lysinibacillus sp. 1 U-2021]